MRLPGSQAARRWARLSLRCPEPVRGGIALAALASLALTVGAFAADDGAECMLGGAGVNLCAKARAIQSEYAPRMPLVISPGATLVLMTASGPTLTALATWERSRAEIENYLRDGNLTMTDFETRLSDGGRIVVCKEPLLTEFVKLGGHVNYLYKSRDNVALAGALVRDCPNVP